MLAEESEYAQQLWVAYKLQQCQAKMAMLKSSSLTLQGKTMRFQYFIRGKRPANGYALIFGFHGGGNCASQVNNSQFSNHLHLYDKNLPNGCIWFVPRSCEEASDMWHKEYMEDFLGVITDAFVVNDLVDINRVFITGYSAGGDGIYHLAPRMADMLAGAAMMAGHPNKVELFNIRNLAFSIQVGGLDGAYNRNNEATKYIRCLNQLQRNYGGFPHQSEVHQGMPHWLQHRDTKIFAWLFSQVRNPYPDLILFKQHPRRRRSFFYYIRLEEEEKIPKNGRSEELVVIKSQNNFEIISNQMVTIMVNRHMVDFKQNVRIYHNGQLTIDEKITSNKEVMERTFMSRKDPYYIFEDQFTSIPSQKVNIQESICKRFNLSLEQKQKQYEAPLPLHPNKNQQKQQIMEIQRPKKQQKQPHQHTLQHPTTKRKRDECRTF